MSAEFKERIRSHRRLLQGFETPNSMLNLFFDAPWPAQKPIPQAAPSAPATPL